ncbi:DUF2161 domain-containing phosphodiesterase [Labrenzia sp. VG12]|uniref:DUF2161 domain-containing phosphodiesterase n=1 Tax=Labrenzia sp. VG12 TaxID=2021862 RepID=UPI000B8C0A3C|nr:DUF2161 family putative PD-(D/E)XK-type phosphodiesterase [Labrenzia sp. VG12]ASP35694.1 hypothetical protein CHH27_22645 [Labrenzia sp. VG12]
MTRILETELYAPVKTFLEGQGYEVKAEVGAADLVACRGDEEPVIVELKTGFTLSLFHQAIDRQAITDLVYVAVARGKGKRFLGALKSNLKLARRLGLGLITVRLPDGHVEVHHDPAPFTPRKSKPRKTRMLREFARRVGDPNTGGSTRVTLVTAYRQDAIRCAEHLAESGPSRGADVAKATGVVRATRMMADDHYGWFERLERGVYGLTPKGREALPEISAKSG